MKCTVHPPSFHRGVSPRSASSACPPCVLSSSSPAVGTAPSCRGDPRDKPIPTRRDSLRTRSLAAVAALSAVEPVVLPTVGISRISLFRVRAVFYEHYNSTGTNSQTNSAPPYYLLLPPALIFLLFPLPCGLGGLCLTSSLILKPPAEYDRFSH